MLVKMKNYKKIAAIVMTMVMVLTSVFISPINVDASAKKIVKK